MIPKPIRLVIVDDDALVRKIIATSLARYPDIEVVGSAPDPYVARDLILQLEPDVVTLDLDMPRMDGITFLKILMKHRPMPIIIMSSYSEANSKNAIEALQAGAVDVLSKGEITGALLAEKIRAAAQARMRPVPNGAPVTRPATPAIRAPRTPGTRQFPERKIILLGASTGGVEALKEVMTSLSDDLPGIGIVQHIPARFSETFANRLNQVCAMEVREARHGDVLHRGLALVAPGGFHMLLKWNSTQYVVELGQGPKVHHQRPAVDILFQSAVRCGAGPHASAALLTGMGADGAAGLLQLREAGARTIAQDEATSVVFGMPCEAIRLGAAQHVLPLASIGRRLEQMVTLPSAKS